MTQSVLIFGAGGQLGVELVRAFRESGADVTALKRAEADIADTAAVDRQVRQAKPGLVINAAAYNLVDVAEADPEIAFRINSLAVRNLARASAEAGAQFVHYSTDYVFDGEKGSPYVEADEPHPLGAYAVSKLAGEFYARAYLADALILRTCGVFGPGGRDTARGNFVETMLRLANSGKPVRVVSDFVASPTYAPAMADRTVELVRAGATGIVHLGGGQPVSWYDFAAIIFRAASLTPDFAAVTSETHKTPARRPRFSALSNSRMESLGASPMPGLETAIASYFARVNQKA